VLLHVKRIAVFVMARMQSLQRSIDECTPNALSYCGVTSSTSNSRSSPCGNSGQWGGSGLSCVRLTHVAYASHRVTSSLSHLAVHSLQQVNVGKGSWLALRLLHVISIIHAQRSDGALACQPRPVYGTAQAGAMHPSIHPSIHSCMTELAGW
jgi:hypothetical protein